MSNATMFIAIRHRASAISARLQCLTDCDVVARRTLQNELAMLSEQHEDTVRRRQVKRFFGDVER